jgi:hypothetical protein
MTECEHDVDIAVDVESIACMLTSQMPLASPEACDQIIETMNTIVPLMCRARAARQRDPPV